MNYFLKLGHQWFLAALITSAPYVNLAADSQVLESAVSSVETVSMQSRHSRREQAIRAELAVLLLNNTVYLHDLIFAIMNTLPPEFITEDLSLLSQNNLALAEALYPQEGPLGFHVQQLNSLLNSYVASIEFYAIDLNLIKDPNDFVLKADLEAALILANQIGLVLSEINPRVLDVQDIQAIWVEYTLLLAEMANDLLTTPMNTPDFTRAAYVYERARTLFAGRLSALLAEALAH
jgi:hypothetical protein